MNRFRELEYGCPEWLHYSVMEDLVGEWSRLLKKSLNDVTLNFPVINDVISSMDEWRFLKKDGAPQG